MDFLATFGLWAAGILGGLVVLAILAVVAMWMGDIIMIATIEEGTAVNFKYRGKFCYCAMEYSGHHFDAAGNICDGPGNPGEDGYGPGCKFLWRFGGWVVYIRPFVEVANYTDYNNPDKFGEGIYIHLGDITPEPFVSMAETAPPENVPLNIEFVSTQRVVNPRKWMFCSPKDVNNQSVKRQDAVLRSWVRSGDQNHAQAARGDGKKLWEQIRALGCMPVFDKIEQDWGLRVLENSIIVEDVGYTPEYQAALEAQSRTALEANAAVEATSGLIMKMVAGMLGMPFESIEADADKGTPRILGLREKLQGDKDKADELRNSQAFRDAMRYATDQVKRDRAAAAGELMDVRVGNSDGTSLRDQAVGLLISGLAAAAKQWGKGGGQGNRGNNPGGGRKNPTKTQEEELEELEAEAEAEEEEKKKKGEAK